MSSGKLKLQIRSAADKLLQLSASAISTASVYLFKKHTDSRTKFSNQCTSVLAVDMSAYYLL